MKIQNINNYINYKGGSKPIKNHEFINNKKYDVIEINSKSSKLKEDEYIVEIKKSTVAYVSKETSAEKINRIKESINNKTYSFDVEEIVKKLLK
ncbi:hypothetical protein SDC9_113434 [bioreactor metagenome]|uniref:Uncharacterized protein n=1 Tax=bioreactor metagenome TaxID=1076179 RepID=A0A645BMQ3_9ZZZZ